MDGIQYFYIGFSGSSINEASIAQFSSLTIWSKEFPLQFPNLGKCFSVRSGSEPVFRISMILFFCSHILPTHLGAQYRGVDEGEIPFTPSLPGYITDILKYVEEIEHLLYLGMSTQVWTLLAAAMSNSLV